MAKPDNPLESFVHTTDEGTITLRPFSRVPSGVFRKTRHLDGMEQMFGLIEASVADDASLEALDLLPVEELGEVFEAWTEAAGIDTPKS